MEQPQYEKKKGNNKNHKCIHRFNYTGEKSNKMWSTNVNLMGKKRKNSDTFTQPKKCKTIKVFKAIYSTQRGETVPRRTSLHLHLGKWVFSDGSSILRPSH